MQGVGGRAFQAERTAGAKGLWRRCFVCPGKAWVRGLRSRVQGARAGQPGPQGGGDSTASELGPQGTEGLCPVPLPFSALVFPCTTAPSLPRLLPHAPLWGAHRDPRMHVCNSSGSRISPPQSAPPQSQAAAGAEIWQNLPRSLQSIVLAKTPLAAKRLHSGVGIVPRTV